MFAFCTPEWQTLPCHQVSARLGERTFGNDVRGANTPMFGEMSPKKKNKPPTPAAPPWSHSCQANLELQGAKGNVQIMEMGLKRTFPSV